MRLLNAAISIAICGASSFAQQPQRWRLIEDWRVGGDVDGPHSFSDVRDLRVLGDGRLVVLEGKDQALHFLTARGAPIRTVGRRGAGPGEFRSANGIVIAPNGQIVVNDPENARLTLFSGTGDLVQTVTHLSWGFDGRWDARFNEQRRLDENGLVSVPGPNRPSPQDARRTWSADFTRADTTRVPQCPGIPAVRSEDVGYRLPGPTGRGFQSLSYPFVMLQQRAQITTPDGSLWIGLGPAYKTIYRVAFGTCTPLATIDLRGPALAVPPAVRENIQAGIRRRAQGLSGPNAPDPDRVRQTLPFFDALAIDDSSRLWVERLVAGTLTFSVLGAGGDRRFDVYSAQGKLIAEVDVPSRVRTPRSGRPFVISGDQVFAFATDVNDIPWLVGFRIARNQ